MLKAALGWVGARRAGLQGFHRSLQKVVLEKAVDRIFPPARENAALSPSLVAATDENQIRAAVGAYVLAESTGDEATLRAAFHPSASIMVSDRDMIKLLNIDSYVQGVITAGLPSKRSPKWRTVSVDVNHNAALAKLEDEIGPMRFTDYLSLLKIEGEWKIVAKLHHLHA